MGLVGEGWRIGQILREHFRSGENHITRAKTPRGSKNVSEAELEGRGVGGTHAPSHSWNPP